jgi:2-polyprenyl-6-hydroxyphenyl methylase/3-demethylubiquinone-9 3-methyltransferase
MHADVVFRPSAAVQWHDAHAESFERGYIVSRSFKERVTTWRALLSEHLRPSDCVLDAGCGAGTIAAEAAQFCAHVHAVDASAEMTRLARRLALPRVDVETASIETLSLRPARYDVILSSSVLEYLDDLDAEVARLADLLKPGGHLIFSLPNADSYHRWLERAVFALTGFPRYYAHVRHVVTPERVADILAGAGLKSVATSHFCESPILPIGTTRRRKTMLAVVAVKHG